MLQPYTPDGATAAAANLLRHCGRHCWRHIARVARSFPSHRRPRFNNWAPSLFPRFSSSPLWRIRHLISDGCGRSNQPRRRKRFCGSKYTKINFSCMNVTSLVFFLKILDHRIPLLLLLLLLLHDPRRLLHAANQYTDLSCYCPFPVSVALCDHNPPPPLLWLAVSCLSNKYVDISLAYVALSHQWVSVREFCCC